MTDMKELARQFNEAVTGDADNLTELCAPKLQMWHIYDDGPVEVEALVMAAMVAIDKKVWPKLLKGYDRYEGTRTFVADDGFVTTRTVKGTLADGTPIRYDYCCVARVENGKVTRVDVYQDRQMAAPLQDLMQSAYREVRR